MTRQIHFRTWISYTTELFVHYLAHWHQTHPFSIAFEQICCRFILFSYILCIIRIYQQYQLENVGSDAAVTRMVSFVALEYFSILKGLNSLSHILL